MDNMSEHTDNVFLFHNVKNKLGDLYWTHVADLHGPFPNKEVVWDVSREEYVEINVDQCLACNTKWPCVTFQVVKEKSESIV